MDSPVLSCDPFVTYQGTGALSGRRQYFVRFAGCDVRCPIRSVSAVLATRASSPTGDTDQGDAERRDGTADDATAARIGAPSHHTR